MSSCRELYMIRRLLRFILILLMILCVAVGIEQITFGQWRVNTGAKVQITPSGRTTSIRYGRTRSFMSQTRYLPSEGRYHRAASGLLPSENRGLRLQSGRLSSSGAYSHYTPRFTAARPYHSVSSIRSLKQPRNYARNYTRRYDRRPGPSAAYFSSQPKLTRFHHRAATGTIRYGSSQRALLKPLELKRPSVGRSGKAYASARGYAGGSIRYGSAASKSILTR